MQFAHIDGQRAEPRPGLQGQCPLCGSLVIARCGEIRVHHWAHRGERRCDKWWEPETAWHRQWKERFPEAWREDIRHAPDGEKHIADIRSAGRRVIEFQHSFLNPDERRAREAFYGPQMIWVVDGMRRKNDCKRFQKAVADWTRITRYAVAFETHWPGEGLPTEWLNSPVPVFFDFGDEVIFNAGVRSAPTIWCLFPGRLIVNGVHQKAIVVEIGRAEFVEGVRSDCPVFEWPTLKPFVEYVQIRQLEEDKAAQAANRVVYRYVLPRPRWVRRRTRRF